MSDAQPFPKLVERFDGENNLVLGCQECAYSWAAHDPDEAVEMVESGRCPKCNGWEVTFAFEEGTRCRNCDKLYVRTQSGVILEDLLDHCCSRACQLQWAYARALFEQPGDAL